MIHNRKTRNAARRAAYLERARAILREITKGTMDSWEGYRLVYGIYLDSNGLLDELRPLFQLPGIDAEGSLKVDDSIRQIIRAKALHWLSEN